MIQPLFGLLLAIAVVVAPLERPSLSLQDGKRVSKTAPDCWATRRAAYFGDDVMRNALRELVRRRPNCKVIGMSVRIARAAVFSFGYDRRTGQMLRALRVSNSDEPTWEAWQGISDAMILARHDENDDMEIGPNIDPQRARAFAGTALGCIVLAHLPN